MDAIVSLLSNPKYELFAQLRAEGKNGTEAAKLAGYAGGSAHVTASRLLKNDKVKARILELQTVVADRVIENTALTASYVTEGLMRIVENCGKPASKWWSPSAANRSLELLGKTLGMFIDRHDDRWRRSDFKTVAEIDAELERIDKEIAELEGAKAARAKGDDPTMH